MKKGVQGPSVHAKGKKYSQTAKQTKGGAKGKMTAGGAKGKGMALKPHGLDAANMKHGHTKLEKVAACDVGNMKGKAMKKEEAGEY